MAWCSSSSGDGAPREGGPRRRPELISTRSLLAIRNAMRCDDGPELRRTERAAGVVACHRRGPTCATGSSCDALDPSLLLRDLEDLQDPRDPHAGPRRPGVAQSVIGARDRCPRSTGFQRSQRSYLRPPRRGDGPSYRRWWRRSEGARAAGSSYTPRAAPELRRAELMVGDRDDGPLLRRALADRPRACAHGRQAVVGGGRRLLPARRGRRPAVRQASTRRQASLRHHCRCPRSRSRISASSSS